jgi:hypothetical protein
VLPVMTADLPAHLASFCTPKSSQNGSQFSIENLPENHGNLNHFVNCAVFLRENLSYFAKNIENSAFFAASPLVFCCPQSLICTRAALRTIKQRTHF